jgi:hypothetical protein
MAPVIIISIIIIIIILSFIIVQVYPKQQEQAELVVPIEETPKQQIQVEESPVFTESPVFQEPTVQPIKITEQKQENKLIVLLNDGSPDLCAQFKDTDIITDPECLTQIWKNVGCTTLTPYKITDKWEQKETFKSLVIDDATKWSQLDTEEARKKCYNLSRKKFNINPCTKYRDSDKNIDDLCLKEIWRVNCTTPTRYLTDIPSIPWAKLQTLRGLKNDANFWSTSTSDTYRKGCYNMTNTQYTTALNNKADIAFHMPKLIRDIAKATLMLPQ